MFSTQLRTSLCSDFSAARKKSFAHNRRCLAWQEVQCNTSKGWEKRSVILKVMSNEGIQECVNHIPATKRQHQCLLWHLQASLWGTGGFLLATLPHFLRRQGKAVSIEFRCNWIIVFHHGRRGIMALACSTWPCLPVLFNLLIHHKI